MQQRIIKRIGNDIFVNLPVYERDGTPFTHSPTYTLEFELRHETVEPIPVTDYWFEDGNRLCFWVLADEVTAIGWYDLVGKVTRPDASVRGGTATYEFDVVKLIRVVAHSELIGTEHSSGVFGMLDMYALSAYHSYVRTTSDDPLLSEADWVKTLKLRYEDLTGAQKEELVSSLVDALVGAGIGVIIKEDDENVEPSDDNVFSSLRVLKEINNAFQKFNATLPGSFIRKDVEDTAAEVITFLKGIIAKDLSYFTDLIASGTITGKNVTALNEMQASILYVLTRAELQDVILKGQMNSETFASGFLGHGFRLKKEGERWVLELDDLIVRKTMQVYELVVQRVRYQGGQTIFGPAGGKLTRVTDGGSHWRCEHDSPEDFIDDDQVLCQTMRVGSRAQNPDGSTTFNNVRVKRYWRKVTSYGAGWFNLSKTDMEPGSDIPEEGDEVAVLGNRTNADRQNAYMIVAVGANSPYTAHYAGINSYSLEGKETTREGNLAGIYDSKFGQLTGYGLYANNVYLRGILRVLSGKTVEEHVQDVTAPMQEEINEIRDRRLLRVEKWASPGYETYRENAPYSATLAVKVFYDDEDVTETISVPRFVWIRLSGSDTLDEVWNELHVNAGASVDITNDDLIGDTSFVCQFWDEGKGEVLGEQHF